MSGRWIEQISGQITELGNRLNQDFSQFKTDNDERLATLEERLDQLELAKNRPPANPSPNIDLASPDEKPGEVLFKDVTSGRLVKAVRGVTPIRPEHANVDVGEVLKAVVLNRLDEVSPETKSFMAAASDGSGAYLLPSPVSSRIIDLARAQSVVTRAGALSFQLEGDQMTLARVVTDPSAHWRSEGGAVQTSDATFGAYILKPKFLATIIPISIELLEDATNVESLLRQVVTKALGAEIDRAILEGSGASNEPLGIVNVTGVNSQSSVGTPTTYGEITTAVGSILAANYPGAISDQSWTLHPAVAAVYDGLKTGITNDNTPLEPTPWVRQLKRFYTTNHQAVSSEYNSIVGDFSQVLVAERYSGVMLDLVSSGTATDEDGSTTHNAVTEFKRFLRAWMRIDSCVMQPSHFTVLSGLTTT